MSHLEEPNKFWIFMYRSDISSLINGRDKNSTSLQGCVMDTHACPEVFHISHKLGPRMSIT